MDRLAPRTGLLAAALFLGGCCSIRPRDQLGISDPAAAAAVARVAIMPVYNPVTAHFDDPCYDGLLASVFPIHAFNHAGARAAGSGLAFISPQETCAALKRHGYVPFPPVRKMTWKDFLWTPASSGLSIPEYLAVGRELGADAVLVSAANIDDSSHRGGACGMAIGYGASLRLLDSRTGKAVWGRYVSEPCSLAHFMTGPMRAQRSHFRRLFARAIADYRSSTSSTTAGALPGAIALVPSENQTGMPEATWVVESQLANKLFSMGYLPLPVSTAAVAGKTPERAARELGVDGLVYATIDGIQLTSPSLMIERTTITLSVKAVDSKGRVVWSGSESGSQDAMKTFALRTTPMGMATGGLKWAASKSGLQLVMPTVNALQKILDKVPRWPPPVRPS